MYRLGGGVGSRSALPLDASRNKNFLNQCKRPYICRAFFGVRLCSSAQPGIHSGGTVLFFPGLQAAVIAAFGFDQFTGVRVLVDLDHAGTALLGGVGLWLAGLALVGIKDGDDVTQALVVGLHQGLELFFELDFLLEPGVVFSGIQAARAVLEVLFLQHETQQVWTISSLH